MAEDNLEGGGSSVTCSAMPRRYAWLVLLVLAASAPFLIHSALSVRSNTTDMSQWLPDGRPEVQRYQQFIVNFGPDDFLLVTWDGCTFDDPRVLQLASAIREATPGEEALWKKVVSGPELLEELTTAPMKLSRRQAASRIYRLLLGEDKKTTGLLITLSAFGRRHPHEVVDSVRRIAIEACDLSKDDLYLAGSVYKASMIDRASERTIGNCIVPSCLLTIAITYFLLRSVRLMTVVLVAASYCGVLSVAIIHWTIDGMSAVLIVVPTLIYVLAVSGMVHLANYFRDARREGADSTEAVRQAIRNGWRPCFYATATTSVGMGSLMASSLSPIREFGFFSCIAVALSLAIMLLVFWSLLTVWPERRGEQQRSLLGHVHAWKNLLLEQILHRAIAWVIGMAAVLVLGLYGLTLTETSVNLFENFRASHRLHRDYAWIEQNLGPQGSFEVLVRFPADVETSLQQRVDTVQTISDALETLEHIGPVVSALRFAPSMPKGSSFAKVAGRSTWLAMIESRRERLVDEGWLAVTSQEETWRLHVRVADYEGPSFENLMISVQDSLRPAIKRAPVQASVEFTGGSPLLVAAQTELLNDLVMCFLLAFGVLVPVMVLVVGRVYGGLITMIPNVFPVVIAFGALGFLGIPIEMGTMVTASVALGIAVDDTLHFLNWYSRGVGSGQSRNDAIRAAFDRCAPAMTQTTLICCAGMLMMIPATFLAASRFAIMMLALLPLALIGDLIFLPAILASPIGRLYSKSCSS